MGSIVQKGSNTSNSLLSTVINLYRGNKMFTVLQINDNNLTTGALKMRDWKMRYWNYRHQTAGVENAGLELSGTGNVWNATCGIT